MDAGQVAVAYHGGVGVLALQPVYQFTKCAALGGGARVAGLAVAVQSALVADAQRVLVVAGDVGAGQLFVACLGDGAVARDVVVVAGEAEAVAMVADELRQRVAAVFARGRAVNDDKIYFSHSILI